MAQRRWQARSGVKKLLSRFREAIAIEMEGEGKELTQHFKARLAVILTQKELN